jgi:hypothetical protein
MKLLRNFNFSSLTIGNTSKFVEFCSIEAKLREIKCKAYIATLGYALDKNYDLVDAVKLANRASSIVVGKVGTATVSLEELFGEIR